MSINLNQSNNDCKKIAIWCDDPQEKETAVFGSLSSFLTTFAVEKNNLNEFLIFRQKYELTARGREMVINTWSFR